MAVALGSDQLEPAVGLNLSLQFQGVSNLNEFALYHLILGISIRVDPAQDLQCLLLFAL